MTGDGTTLATDPAGGAGSAAGILAAALHLIGRWGIGKTTLADVAREAGCSRATLYRVFPGGKQELFLALGRSELARYFAGIQTRIDAADTADEALTQLIVEASRRLADHEALQFVLVREPDIVLPFLGFHQIDRLYAAAVDALAPALERLLPEHAAWAVEWSARAVLSYAFSPSASIDLRHEPDAHHLVTHFLLPALQPDRALVVHA